MSQIDPTAIIAPTASIGDDVTIGPYCVIGPKVTIGERCQLHSHVVMDGSLTIGSDNEFFQFCSIGAPPQDTGYQGEDTRTVIGSGNTFREFATIHRGTTKDQLVTTIGNDSLFMSYSHIGHDAVVGNNCVIVNSVNVAGHVHLGDRVIISGATNVSQFVRIGQGAFIGGASAVDRDVPPYCTGYGNRMRLKGINIVGMRRGKLARQIITEVVDFYRGMEASVLSPRNFVTQPENIDEFSENEIINMMVEFIQNSKVGIAPFI
jgi:UDP-N-acetylglucosamine acyltransferase